MAIDMNDVITYHDFLNRKKHSTDNFGFEPIWMPDSAFDFQEHIITKSVRKGRIGLFEDTGLGKTMQQIAIAENIIRKTNRRVLILTPIAVAFQFIEEAGRIGVGDIAHSKDGKLSSKIIVCNYERLHLLNPDDFECVMLDESSILKNFAGKIRDQIVAFIKRVPYRFLATATPSPNDFIELGNSSEALGYMGYMDMLTKFFKSNQGSVDSNNRNIGEKFYLKPHAERDFFAWVNQWSVMVKSLMHKLIVEDSTQCFTAMPDYVLIFTKKGDNAVPVTHSNGLKRYFGETPILPNILRAFNNANETKFNEDELWEYLKNTYENHDDPKSNKLSHYIWQRYASSVWDDIRIDNVLPFRDSREEDDEKHVHPLQLDVIDRLVELYSNEGDVVLTPFMGVGSEVYSPVSMGRKAIGIELKDSYFKQAKINIGLASKRFENEICFKQGEVFDFNDLDTEDQIVL